MHAATQYYDSISHTELVFLHTYETANSQYVDQPISLVDQFYWASAPLEQLLEDSMLYT